MRVLVVAASKHGSTAEIAASIGDSFRGLGFECAVFDVTDDPDPVGYEVVVLGSGVYAGQWLKAARRFVDRYATTLAKQRVWLFSSGPLGDPLQPDDEDAVQADDLVSATGATGHRLFAGALDKSKLSFGERAIIKAVRAPDGDYRDWEAIDTWVVEIADSLRQS